MARLMEEMAMNRRTPLTAAFDEWTAERVADKRMRPNTRTTYLRHGRQFVAIIGNKAVGNVDFDDARQWMNSTSGLAASTVASRMGAIASFFDYCIRQGIIDSNPMSRLERPRVELTNPRPTPKAAIARTLAHCQTVGDRRAHLMIRLGAELGLRRFEIAKVARADVDFEQMELDVEGKGGKRLNLPLSPGLAAELGDWIEMHDVVARGWLFPSSKNADEPISPFRCGRIITEASQRCGEYITPHTLRHRAGTDMLHAGGLKAASRLLRHSSSATTDIYARFDTSDLRAHVDRLAE